MPPEPDSFVADIDAALMEQVLDVPKRKRKPDIEHHREADDLGAGLEVAEGGSFAHLATLRNRRALLKTVSSDKAHRKHIRRTEAT